jgi:AcrR family transcriptional regulator
VAEALTREAVLAAARARLERDGASGLSLRAVARDLGVTAPALYAYVEGKGELLAAIAGAHFERLADRFAAVDAADPVERIRGLSRAYVDHALESPALFELLFRYPPAPTAGIDAFPPATRAFESALAATTAAAEAGLLRVPDVGLAAMTMWAAVHGAAQVLLMGFPLDDLGAAAFVDSVIDTMLAGLTTR